MIMRNIISLERSHAERIMWASKRQRLWRELWPVRSSRLEVFCKNGALKILAKFTGKHLYQNLFFNKVADLRQNTCGGCFLAVADGMGTIFGITKVVHRSLIPDGKTLILDQNRDDIKLFLKEKRWGWVVLLLFVYFWFGYYTLSYPMILQKLFMVNAQKSYIE